MLKRALTLSDAGTLVPEMLTFGYATTDDILSHRKLESLSYEDAHLAFDRCYLAALLTATGGKKSKAAQLAGIDRSHLYTKLRDCGLSDMIREKE